MSKAKKPARYNRAKKIVTFYSTGKRPLAEIPEEKCHIIVCRNMEDSNHKIRYVVEPNDKDDKNLRGDLSKADFKAMSCRRTATGPHTAGDEYED